MDTKFYWGADGEGTTAATSVGLSNLQPLMIKSRHAGGDGYFFAATGNKYYLWNMNTGDVFEYVKPADLQGILGEMRKPGGTGKVERNLLAAGF
ncbi:hypothetical protein HIM_09689 [Hirsutella minnesotensis 3608]|uniref:Uncharacterized protein n=1 Tax=Hirsutella minnesotensis 3608 TaxID=1043627 RepID=A0A0F7ZS88_9HYPO|nr:hypothetical protein HIM_09689 [Hirsutella minnesotensis 3608]